MSDRPERGNDRIDRPPGATAAPSSGAGAGTRWIISRVVLRHWRREPSAALTLVAIVALGIAVFFAVRLANRAAVVSFQNFSELITSETDGAIAPAAGDLPESTLLELRELLGDRAVTLIPVVEASAILPNDEGAPWLAERTTYQLLGLDLVSLQNFARPTDRSWFDQPRAGKETGSEQFWELLRSPRSLYVSEAWADARGLSSGAEIALIVGDRRVEFRIAGLIPPRQDGPAIPATVMVIDLPALQQLLGRPGRIDRVQWLVEGGEQAAALRHETYERLVAAAADRWRVHRPADRRAAAALMTRAFRLNLSILSLLALLVGLYLVFQALDGAVVRRRSELGTLRSLGVSPRALSRAHLLEAALYGGLGSAVGVFIGWGGAQLAVRAVGRTVNVMYYATTVDAAALDLGEAVTALVLGTIAALAAGWLPARAAAEVPPAQLMNRAGAGPNTRMPRLLLPALVALIAGAALCAAPPWRAAAGLRVPWAGYLAGVAWIVGASLLAAAALPALAHRAAPFSARSASLRLALGALRRAGSRHRWALAGLIAALAMSVGMAILVASFEFTMRSWIERTLQADLYIASDGAQSASADALLTPQTWQQLTGDRAVAAANVVAAAPIELQETATLLAATDLAFFARHVPLSWVERPKDEAIWDPARNTGLALVSEAFSERFDRHRGDRVELPTPRGVRTLEIVGIYADYGNERGTLMIDRHHYRAWFDDERVATCQLWLRPGEDVNAVRARLLRTFPGLQILKQGDIRSEALRIFRQTFGITYALEAIGVAVALAGLALALAALLFERREQLTTLRALGMSHREIARAAGWEGLLLSLLGVMTGMVLGSALGWLLIRVINKQTFGWTLGYSAPIGLLALLCLVVLTCGWLVSYAVGRRGAALPADREE